jgi:hypothetical protein
VAGQHDGLAAELAHGDVERHARARRGLVEHHREHLAGQGLFVRRLAFATPCLQRRAGVEDAPEFGAGEILEIEKVASRTPHSAAPRWAIARISASST